MSAQNQRFFTSERESIVKPCKEPFTIVYNRNLLEASRRLNGTEFKVFVYLLSQKPNVKLELSPMAIANEVNISKHSVQNAITKLVELGYLVYYNKNCFFFFDYLQREEDENETTN